jgi:hypothetical protein
VQFNPLASSLAITAPEKPAPTTKNLFMLCTYVLYRRLVETTVPYP